MSSEEGDSLLLLTTDIVAAYVSSNTVDTDEVATLIGEVHAALRRLDGGGTAPVPAPPQEPAVAIRKSLTQEYLICLEDGKKFKSLKRHLRSDHNLSPAEYRSKWGLKPDYPMVAPDYAAARSNLAKLIGLGQRGGSGGRRPGKPVEAAEAPSTARKSRTPRAKSGPR